MKKFEYKIICSNDREDLEETLNLLGKGGWELVSVATDDTGYSIGIWHTAF